MASNYTILDDKKRAKSRVEVKQPTDVLGNAEVRETPTSVHRLRVLVLVSIESACAGASGLQPLFHRCGAGIEGE